MKKFYSCLPVFLLIGCAQPPFLREQTGTATSALRKSNWPTQIVLMSVSLFRMCRQTLRRINHYQTRTLIIPHQK